MRAQFLVFLCLLEFGPAFAATAKARPKAPIKNFENIIKTYNFVGDFEPKEETRQISDEIFWRYPLEIPAIDFPIVYPSKDSVEDFPKTPGQGKAYDHINRGRQYFLQGDFENARLTWLGGKKRYGSLYDHHRRNDFFISQAFLLKAKEHLQAENGDYSNPQIKNLYDAASAFLSFAFIVKEQDPSQKVDPLIERVMPKGLYNLAAVYWKYNRFAGAFGAADSGLNYLRKTGRKDFRSEFYRIMAESHIKNRSYLEAIQFLDLAIRQDPQPDVAAAAFTRAGDIYFDLNNYELAEDVYNMGALIDEDLSLVDGPQLVLRGEALFWLGKFSESQKILNFALDTTNTNMFKKTMSPNLAAWAALRFADGYLARREFDKARLEYYKVRSLYRSNQASKIALVRETCLDLPYYTGKNVLHARKDIDGLKNDPDLPKVLQELAWSCQVASYTSRERTEEMLDRVRAFATEYPDSKFLQSFVIPLTSFQRSKIKKYLDDGDYFSAVDFYEKNKDRLFKYVDPDLGKFLFSAYLETQRSDQAIKFWRFIDLSRQPTDEELIDQILVLQEYLDSKDVDKKSSARWEKEFKRLNTLAQKRGWRVDFSTKLQLKLERLKRTSKYEDNMVWVMNIYANWSAKNENILCDSIIPLLSQALVKETVMGQMGGKERAKEILLAMTEKQFPDLFKDDESCAISVLDILAKLLRDSPREIHRLIMKKRDWSLVAGYLNWVWVMSEYLEQKGLKIEAQDIWRLILDRAPDGAVEKNFAAQRLQTQKTEFEKLWD